jgi:class 3 adenylate cyclase/TolB-like protein/tetratricopeptide (TPR) repeat protein
MVKSLRDLRLASPVGPFASKSENDKFRDPTSRLNVVESPTKERRLAAILAADVAGYSRLVGADELGTLNRLQVHWDTLIEPTIRSHHVRIVRIAGDGVLAEFASVVDAVECAVEMQRAMAERNAGIPAEERIQFRMGINVGDIIVDRGDLWGDGVNVAARLEALAEPGGICVSSRVQEDVQGKLDLAFEDAGEHQLKNIARPVRVYRVQLDETASRVDHRSCDSKDERSPAPPAPAPTVALPPDRHGAVRRLSARSVLMAMAFIVLGASAAGWWRLATTHDTPGSSPTLAAASSPVTATGSPAEKAVAPMMSVVVLPFLNLSGDPQQDRFCDGITDSLTTDLSRALPGAFVVSRDTAFTYKGKAADARQIGRELDVRFVVEGSVLPDGDLLRVNSQLIDAETGGHLWAERFDLKRSDVLEVQDDIVGRLSRAISLKMIDSEARRSERERPRSAEVLDLVMRAKALLNRPTSRVTMAQARNLFEQAATIDGDNPEALAGIATTHIFEVLNGYHESGNEQRLDQAGLLLARALATDPHLLLALKAKAALLRAQGHFDEAITAAEAVVAENPGEPWAYKEIGLSSMYVGRVEQSLGWFAKADRFGPRDPGRWTWLDSRGHALILLGRDQEAIRYLRMALEANPNAVSSHAFLAAAYALTGRLDEARAELAQHNRLRPGATVANFRRSTPVPLRMTGPGYQQMFERLKDGLRKAGMPEQAEAP